MASIVVPLGLIMLLTSRKFWRWALTSSDALPQKELVWTMLKSPVFSSKPSCGRTNLNYTGSSTRGHFCGLQRASNSIIPWPVGKRPDKPPNAGSNKVPHTKTRPEIRTPSHFTSQARILYESLKVTSVSNWWQLLQNSHKFQVKIAEFITRALYMSPAQISC
jgi:hypothetical protein